MTIRYVDILNGNSANNGLSFATAKKYIKDFGTTEINAGDVVHIAQTSAFIETGLVGTFTSYLNARATWDIKNLAATTNATPIVCTLATHPFQTGDIVAITGVTSGNIGANGLWKITKIDANTFSLDGSKGTGTSGALGQVGDYSSGVIRVPSTVAKALPNFTPGVWTNANSATLTAYNSSIGWTSKHASCSLLNGTLTGGPKKLFYLSLTAALDLSMYQVINFLWHCNSVVADSSFSIKLCSDTLGDTPIASYNLLTGSTLASGFPNCGRISVETGGNLPSGINSIAVYSNIASAPTNVFFNKIFFTRDNTYADGYTFDYVYLTKNADGTLDTPYDVLYIDDNMIFIDHKRSLNTNNKSYIGVTYDGTKTLYKGKVAYNVLNNVDSLPSKINAANSVWTVIEGGYDPATDLKTGVTLYKQRYSANNWFSPSTVNGTARIEIKDVVLVDWYNNPIYLPSVPSSFNGIKFTNITVVNCNGYIQLTNNGYIEFCNLKLLNGGYIYPYGTIVLYFSGSTRFENLNYAFNYLTGNEIRVEDFFGLCISYFFYHNSIGWVNTLYGNKLAMYFISYLVTNCQITHLDLNELIKHGYYVSLIRPITGYVKKMSLLAAGASCFNPQLSPYGSTFTIEELTVSSDAYSPAFSVGPMEGNVIIHKYISSITPSISSYYRNSCTLIKKDDGSVWMAMNSSPLSKSTQKIKGTSAFSWFCNNSKPNYYYPVSDSVKVGKYTASKNETITFFLWVYLNDAGGQCMLYLKRSEFFCGATVDPVYCSTVNSWQKIQITVTTVRAGILYFILDVKGSSFYIDDIMDCTTELPETDALWMGGGGSGGGTVDLPESSYSWIS